MARYFMFDKITTGVFITQMLVSVSSVPLWSICLFNKSIIDER